MVTVCNEHLFRIAAADMTMRDALAASNALVCESASGFARLVSEVALKRVGLADLRALLATGGKSVIGYGEHGEGADRALHAARSALCNPLLETAMQSAGRLLVTISGGEDLRLYEVDAAIAWLSDHVEPGADIVWGATTDATLGGRVRIGIAATRLVAPSRVTVEQPVAAPIAAAALAPVEPAICDPVDVAVPLSVPVAPEPSGPAPSAPVVTARAPTRLAVPALPPMERAAEQALRPAPDTPPVPVMAEIVAAEPEPIAPAVVRAGNVLVLDREYMVNDRIMRVRARPATSLADRVYGVLKDSAQTLRRGAALHLAA
jgi:cell division protein FtsZ